MLDIRLLRETPEIIRSDLKKRNRPDLEEQLDAAIRLDKEWRASLQKMEELKHRRNVLSREVAELKKAGKDVESVLKEVKHIPDEIKDLEDKTEGIKSQVNAIMMVLPNILHESVPIGKDGDDNKVIKEHGKKHEFSFEPKSHVDILEEKGLADTMKAGEVSGSRFYYLKKELVLLDYALMKFALDFLYNKGFTLIEPPYMLKRSAYETMTSLQDFEDVMYKIDGEDLFLIATSEHPIGTMHLNETLDPKELPLNYAGVSPCFRREVGAHGKDTKGIFRVHHFHKIEQFVFCKPEDSWKIHEELLKNAEELFELLELPYRVVNICTGDIGSIAAKKYDIEVWMPVQKEYREVVSCSNCTEYQARRLQTKYVDGNDRKFVHTLNSTAIATSRVIVAMMENFQNKDGSFNIPKALLPYMNGVKVIGKQKK
jgi:seryl-tRNA synthetase